MMQDQSQFENTIQLSVQSFKAQYYSVLLVYLQLFNYIYK